MEDGGRIGFELLAFPQNYNPVATATALNRGSLLPIPPAVLEGPNAPIGQKVCIRLVSGSPPDHPSRCRANTVG